MCVLLLYSLRTCMYSLGEYIELPSVVQIQYTLDIHGTTITCTGQFLPGTMTVIVAILPYSG